jgi:hypothetical protein
VDHLKGAPLKGKYFTIVKCFKNQLLVADCSLLQLLFTVLKYFMGEMLVAGWKVWSLNEFTYLFMTVIYTQSIFYLPKV